MTQKLLLTNPRTSSAEGCFTKEKIMTRLSSRWNYLLLSVVVHFICIRPPRMPETSDSTGPYSYYDFPIHIHFSLKESSNGSLWNKKKKRGGLFLCFDGLQENLSVSG